VQFLQALRMTLEQKVIDETGLFYNQAKYPWNTTPGLQWFNFDTFNPYLERVYEESPIHIGAVVC
jgi:hypothetical protein